MSEEVAGLAQRWDDAVRLPAEPLGLGRVLFDERHEFLGCGHERGKADALRATAHDSVPWGIMRSAGRHIPPHPQRRRARAAAPVSRASHLNVLRRASSTRRA
jgi:hypothetical protein